MTQSPYQQTTRIVSQSLAPTIITEGSVAGVSGALPSTLGRFHAFNNNAVPAFLHFFNISGSALGSNPHQTFGIEASSSLSLDVGKLYWKGLSVSATTLPTASGTLPNALTVNLDWSKRY